MKRLLLLPFLLLVFACRDSSVTGPASSPFAPPGPSFAVSTSGVPVFALQQPEDGYCSAHDVNDEGAIVGFCYWPGTGDRAAYWPDMDSPPVPLPDPTEVLGRLEGTNAYGMNSSGEVVGLVYSSARSSDGGLRRPWRALKWPSPTSSPVYLPVECRSGGLLDFCQQTAYDINDDGRVVGYHNALDGSVYSVGFLWRPDNSLAELLPLNIRCQPRNILHDRARPHAINSSGEIAGESWVEPGVSYCERAARWTDDGSAHLPAENLGFTGTSWAYGMNDVGQIVGDFRPGNHAYLWEGGSHRDLGALDDNANSSGQDVNELGQVVGWSNAPAGDRAFLWDPADETMHDLGALECDGDGGEVYYSSEANAINDAGMIVGRSDCEGDEEIEQAVVWLWNPVLEVVIDIKPGGDPNSINCDNPSEVVTVAILSTQTLTGEPLDFDATTVDHTTVYFEGAGETHVHKKTGLPRRHEEDVDHDGDTDLVFHFRLADTALYGVCNATEGTLTGETYDGQLIEGTDAVRMID